jgi:mycothiol synthase
VEIPRGYTVHPLVPSDQPGIRQFAECLNQSYRQLAGHTDVTPQDIRSWFDAASYLDGGICLLRRNEEPVGTLRVTREDEGRNSGEVSALGIVDGHRGQGLGRALLRYAVAFALKNGLGPLSLSVHADNEAAITLYRSEGFALTTTMVCYALACRQANSRSEV